MIYQQKYQSPLFLSLHANLWLYAEISGILYPFLCVTLSCFPSCKATHRVDLQDSVIKLHMLSTCPEGHFIIYPKGATGCRLCRLAHTRITQHHRSYLSTTGLGHKQVKICLAPESKAKLAKAYFLLQ